MENNEFKKQWKEYTNELTRIAFHENCTEEQYRRITELKNELNKIVDEIARR
jgi:hypothetical protein